MAGVAGLEARFKAQLERLSLPPGRWIAAVSGGPDSLVLLDLLHRTLDWHGRELLVAHADHGLLPESAQVARGVEVLAAGLGLRCETTRLSLDPGATETQARAGRWRWLHDLRERRAPALLLTAHHQDDQVETVLMRVLRGSGPAGLGGMPALRDHVARPLLSFRRSELGEYVAARRLVPWDDPANVDPRHLRSWIRGVLLPVLRERLPDVDARLGSVAQQAAHDRRAWDAVIEVVRLDSRAEQGGISVASGPLRSYDSELAARLLMAAARRAGLVLGPRRAAQAAELARRGQSGARVMLGDGWMAEVRFERVALVRDVPVAPNHGSSWRIQLPSPGNTARTDGWRVRCSAGAAPARHERVGFGTWLVPGQYEVRAWRSGDRIFPLGGTGRRLVVRCMQDAKVGRGERPGWPVVIREGTVIWVPGVCRSAHALPAEGSEAWRVDVERA